MCSGSAYNMFTKRFPNQEWFNKMLSQIYVNLHVICLLFLLTFYPKLTLADDFSKHSQYKIVWKFCSIKTDVWTYIIQPTFVVRTCSANTHKYTSFSMKCCQNNKCWNVFKSMTIRKKFVTLSWLWLRRLLPSGMWQNLVW